MEFCICDGQDCEKTTERICRSCFRSPEASCIFLSGLSGRQGSRVSILDRASPISGRVLRRELLDCCLRDCLCRGEFFALVLHFLRAMTLRDGYRVRCARILLCQDFCSPGAAATTMLSPNPPAVLGMLQCDEILSFAYAVAAGSYYLSTRHAPRAVKAKVAD